jgi:hypothetical protein
MYEIVAPNGKVHTPPEGRCWATLESEFLKLKAAGKIHWGKDGNGVPRIIRYLSEVDGLVPWTWWPHDEVGHTDESRKEVQQIFGTQTAFDTPKPLRLIARVLQIGCGPNDLVLDFFAGSGTTAHAVHKLNAEDGGQRRVILVSNSEATADEPEKNLCRDVCATRVRRAIAGYTTPGGEMVAGLGGDFAYLRCRRIAPGRLLEIDHAQVWTALQLIHRETLAPFTDAPPGRVGVPPAERRILRRDLPDGGGSSFRRDAETGGRDAHPTRETPPFLFADDEESALIYVPRFRREDAPLLRKQARQSAGVVLYSWQPELVRQHVRAQHIQHEQIPESLARRFGLKA